MGRTALYRDPSLYRPARAEVELEPDLLVLAMPGGWVRKHALNGVAATTADGFVRDTRATAGREQRRFVRMLVLERGKQRAFVITPPDQGAVAPNVVRVPEAPPEAAVVDTRAWESLAAWLLGGGRLALCSIGELAKLACIASPQFAVVIGEVAAERALELAWAEGGPLRGGADPEAALQPLVEAAKSSPRAAEALISALAHAAGEVARRRRPR